MTEDPAARDALRERWRRFASENMGDPGAGDFLHRGLSKRLAEPSVHLLLMPGDPERERLSMDERMPIWLKDRGAIEVLGSVVQLPADLQYWAHGLALVDGLDQRWSSYLAVHRSGALEWGLGGRGGWSGADRTGEPQGVVALTPTVARVAAILALTAELQEFSMTDGPWQLVVGVRSAGCVLAMLGEGWAEPGDWNNHVGPCREEQLRWRLEFATLPTVEETREAAHAVGERLEHAWSCGQSRYLSRTGEQVGQIDPRKVN